MNKLIKFATQKLHMNDKMIHGTVTALTVIIFGLWNLTFSVGLAIGLSVGKEVGDYFNPKSSGYALDLLADLIGIIIGFVICVAIRSVLC